MKVCWHYTGWIVELFSMSKSKIILYMLTKQAIGLKEVNMITFNIWLFSGRRYGWTFCSLGAPKLLGVWVSCCAGARTAADGGINSLTYGCAIDRTAWGGGAHYTNLPQRLKNQGQALTCDYFFHFPVNAWSVGSGETNSCHREPETRHVKESKEICQERRINQWLK